MKHILLFIIPIIIFTSCDQLVSPRRYKEEYYYVITGRLYENEAITPENAIFVGKTILADGGNIEEFVISDAQVKIIDLENEVVFPLQFIIDLTSNPINLGYFDPTGSLIPQALKSYRIEAVLVDSINYAQDTLWAEATVPKPIEIEIDTTAFTADTTLTGWPELVYDTANIDHPLTIKAEDQQTMNLYFRFFCLESWEDAIYTIEYMGNDSPEDEEEYEDPNTGFPRKIEYFNLYEPELDLQSGNYYVIDRGYKGAIIFYGRYSITVYNIDDNFFKYLYKPEGYNFGGINGGIGYFGAVSGNTVYTKVIEGN